MGLKVSNKAATSTPAKKVLKLSDISLKEMKFVDDEGDITQQVVDELPEGTEVIDLTITVVMPSEDE